MRKQMAAAWGSYEMHEKSQGGPRGITSKRL